MLNLRVFSSMIRIAMEDIAYSVQDIGLHAMYATPDTRTSAAASAGSLGCAEAHGTISDLLSRCDALRGELEQLRAEHAASLRAADAVRHAYEAERQRRAHLAQTTLGLLSALDTPARTLVAAYQPVSPARHQERAA